MSAAGEETVGERIRRLRRRRGLTQRQLEAPGVGFAYISRIESGARNPSLAVLRILARRLGVPLEYLETGAPVPVAAERELRLSDAELELRLNRDLERAQTVFAAELEHDDEPFLRARAHAGLGLLAVRRGVHAGTIRHLEAATGSGYLPPETSPDLYRALGAAYVSTGQPARAARLFEDCLAQLRERVPDDATLQVRFGVYAATAYSELGRADQARTALEEASRKADESASPQVRINLYWGMSIEAWRAADSEGALAYIRRAIGLLEASEDTYHLALANLRAAQLLNLDGRSEEAGRHLERADRLFLLGADQSDLGILRAEQAIHAAALKDADEAMARATDAARLLGDDARHLGLKWQALASAHRLAGDVNQAESYYSKALDVLTEQKQWREAATVAREWGRFLRELGRESEAFDVMDRAAVLHIRHVGKQAARARDA
jgi:transcriptional regulator with XRE-family HTH domain